MHKSIADFKNSSTFAPELNCILYHKKHIKNEQEKDIMFLSGSRGFFCYDGAGNSVAEPVPADGSG